MIEAISELKNEIILLKNILNTKKNNLSKIIFLLAFIVILQAGVISFLFFMPKDKYVTSSNGIYCYPEHAVHKNLKNKIYFDSLEDCHKFLSLKNQ